MSRRWSFDRPHANPHLARLVDQIGIDAMLNSKLSGSDFKHCARLIEAFVGSTSMSGLLKKDSFVRIVVDAKRSEAQVGQDHPLWRVMARLFPEVLDGLVRAELADLGQLPAWATSPSDMPITDLEAAE